MRQIIEEKLLRLIRFYTFNTLINKGKYWIFQAALNFIRSRPDSLLVRLKDGRRFFVNLTTGMQESVYFVGEFERVLTEIAIKLINKGDICIDVGANFGWYTSLMALHSAGSGAVHAFEPTPQSFYELKRNHELRGSPANVFLNNLALGDKPDTVKIHVFDGLGTGHASLVGKQDVESAGLDCKMITLDSYLEENRIEHIDFVKVDIEGAELMFLKGAERLFQQEILPVFLMEMAAGQTESFGYQPDELIKFIATRGEYEFFAVNEYNGTVGLIDGFDGGHIGANVFCIPRNAPPEKRAAISEYLVK